MRSPGRLLSPLRGGSGSSHGRPKVVRHVGDLTSPPPAALTPLLEHQHIGKPHHTVPTSGQGHRREVTGIKETGDERSGQAQMLSGLSGWQHHTQQAEGDPSPRDVGRPQSRRYSAVSVQSHGEHPSPRGRLHPMSTRTIRSPQVHPPFRAHLEAPLKLFSRQAASRTRASAPHSCGFSASRSTSAVRSASRQHSGDIRCATPPRCGASRRPSPSGSTRRAWGGGRSASSNSPRCPPSAPSGTSPGSGRPTYSSSTAVTPPTCATGCASPGWSICCRRCPTRSGWE